MKQLPISVTNNFKPIYRVVAIDGEFFTMKKKEKYFEIINNGLKDKLESGYYEHHHIVPKSLC